MPDLLDQYLAGKKEPDLLDQYLTKKTEEVPPEEPTWWEAAFAPAKEYKEVYAPELGKMVPGERVEVPIGTKIIERLKFEWESDWPTYIGLGIFLGTYGALKAIPVVGESIISKNAAKFAKTNFLVLKKRFPDVIRTIEDAKIYATLALKHQLGPTLEKLGGLRTGEALQFINKISGQIGSLKLTAPKVISALPAVAEKVVTPATINLTNKLAHAGLDKIGAEALAGSMDLMKEGVNKLVIGQVVNAFVDRSIAQTTDLAPLTSEEQLGFDEMRGALEKKVTDVLEKEPEVVEPIPREVAPEVAPKAEILAKHQLIYGKAPSELTWFRATKVTYKAEEKRFGKSALGTYFSQSKKVAESYGKNVKSFRLDVKNPFNIFSTPEDYLKVAKALGDEVYMSEYNRIVEGGDTPILTVYAGGNTINPNEVLNRWIDKYGADGIRNAMSGVGYDALLNMSGETSSTWGPSAPELAVFKPSSIKPTKVAPKAEIPKEVVPEAKPEILAEEIALEVEPPTKPPIPPTPPPTGMPQEPERDPLIKLTELIKQAKPIRAKIETQYTKERAKRFAEIGEFIDKNVDEVGGEEGYRIILSKMKGELIPEEERRKLKLSFEPVKDKLNEEEVKDLFLRTWKHPYLNTGEKLSAANGLMDLFEGEIPQPKQLVLLEEIYGSEFIKAILKKRAWGAKAKEFVIEIANIPRVALSTADMSGVLRQNIIFMVAEPVISVKATAKAFQGAFKPKIAEQYFDDLRKAEDYNFMKKMGISITDPTRATLVEREEAFISRFLQKVPIVNIPVGFAERGYTTLLTKVRVDVFRKWAEELKSQDLDPVKNEDVFRAAADVVNTFSGRGSLGKAGNRIRPQLNTIFYSPGLVAARFQALNLLWYIRQPKPVRKKAIGAFAKFVAAGLTTLALVKVYKDATGASDDEISVETNMTSADSGKIKIGNTRYDIWGGHQQFARVFAQIIMGQRKSTTTGEIISLNKDEYPFTTRWETALRFMEGKFAPTPALVKELMQGARTFKGEKMTVGSVAFEKFTPMWIQDVAEVYAEGGFEATMLPGAAAFMGVGVQTYGPRKKKRKKRPIY